MTRFCLPINSLFFIAKIYNLIDEEINVLFIGMLYLGIEEFLICDAVDVLIL